ncbi:tyrosinase family oxidase copper chaperone [Actinacidiphila yeochonensis]|uniref:tyrosinase family oxidase copper chaperone n=1 Tax=Actinacidiphila yeochonensis TaxID=89050 RepID=UPI00099DA473|nr:tyrosinase family oxidase copper chaperone [Actinacidiphila yeochonensis]
MVSRRRVLRTGFTTAAAVSGTAAALLPVTAGSHTAGSATAPGDPGPDDGKPGGALFDEVYRGRHIQGYHAPDEPSGVAVLVDGRQLDLMRRVDGSFISMANHYQPYLTPVETARAAVDVIGRAQLSEAAAVMHHH